MQLTGGQVFRYLSTGSRSRTVSSLPSIAKGPGQKKPRYVAASAAVEVFIRRFLLHVLPDRMHRMRHFGILANGGSASPIDSAREALGPARAAGLAEYGMTLLLPQRRHL